MLEISYPLFVLWLLALAGLIAFLCYYAAKCRALRLTNATIAKAYAELVAGSITREHGLLAEVAFERARGFARGGDHDVEQGGVMHNVFGGRPEGRLGSARVGPLRQG